MTEGKTIIFINRDEGYIEIMGNKIYTDRGWEEFLDYLKNQELTIEKQSKEIERQKEINKEHQEENGKLRQENKELTEKVEKYRGDWDE